MYHVFLMIELARIQGVIPKDLEYDLTWEHGQGLADEFDNSKFNVGTKGLYECIQDFLEAKQPRVIEA